MAASSLRSFVDDFVINENRTACNDIRNGIDEREILIITHVI